MSHRLRSGLLACALLAPLLAIGASAHADVRPADAASPSIQVGRPDRAGDVHVERGFRTKLTKRVLRSVDVARTDYDVDRVQQVLSITYTARHRAVPSRPYRFYYATIVSSDLQDYAAPTVVVLSRPGASTVRILDPFAEGSHRCAGGSSVASHRGRVVTASVPFTCLGDVDHGRMLSGIGLERARGGDVAYDTTRPTRDLPLTEYVAPVVD